MVVSNHSCEINKNTDTAVFKIMDAACFVWKRFDDAYIIYDTRSGHSQALNEVAYEILKIIEEKPCQFKEIIFELETILDRKIENETVQQIELTVEKFDEMGLIEPIKKI